jgi:hypothetical protein
MSFGVLPKDRNLGRLVIPPGLTLRPAGTWLDKLGKLQDALSIHFTCRRNSTEQKLSGFEKAKGCTPVHVSWSCPF